MDQRCAIWNVLHDGTILAIERGESQELCLRVEIAYLAGMLAAGCEEILVMLKGCSQFEFLHWEDGSTTSDILQISAYGTEILSTASEDVPAVVTTTFGELRLAFQEFKLSLPDGSTLSYERLCAVCEAYWSDFEARGKVL